MLFSRLRSEKVAPEGSKHAHNLYRFQVSGVSPAAALENGQFKWKSPRSVILCPDILN
jgi:hypothetical protein